MTETETNAKLEPQEEGQPKPLNRYLVGTVIFIAILLAITLIAIMIAAACNLARNHHSSSSSSFSSSSFASLTGL